ncbi:MAG: nucleotide exchange factor GrpE [Candidatus Helarchaeales archaeon]
MEPKNEEQQEFNPSNASDEEIVDVSLTEESSTPEEIDVDAEEEEEEEDSLIEIKQSELDQLKNELEKTKKEKAEAEDKLLYVRADYENYKKILEREKREFYNYAKKDLLLKILDFVDDFERALPSIKQAKDVSEAVEAYELLYKQLQKLLEIEEVKPIEAVGKSFDVNLHEVMLSEETDEVEEGTVLEELKKGYYLKDKVLRPSLIKIAKSKKKEEE